ncbi:LamG domain-containing protein [Spirulina sp. 06S082]|uniref:LamG domain-containing protein n=1 Tax=Spirulina sp. 06S082 TaxID=3110248 RepID=UPI002B1F9C3E|nr:LamG-like jellyroll fold domain-containing protein [Spirulina sp. 06S082]MEA5470621.1 LamG-like jellyroll fold domain-containing protein [Spirulina sp. 06S082]
MTARLPSFDKNGQEGALFNEVNASIEGKLQQLKDFQVSILDVSIREPTAYSSWSHRLSDKMDTLKLIREFGFQDIMLGEFKPWDTVDEQFVKLLSDAEKDGCFAFSPVGAIKNGAIDQGNSVPLQKAAALAPNVLFEFSISTADEAKAEETLERFDLSVEWIRQAWKDRGIEHDDRNGRIYINIYDTFEAFYRNQDVYVRVIKYLGAHPHIDAVLFEDELGTTFHFQVGEVTKLVRSLVPPPKKVLVHLHENSGTMYASALEVALNGANGLWAGFVPVGGMLNNAASSVFLANLLRVGNENVKQQFKMETTIPLVRKLDRINQPSPTDYCHPIIGEGAYLSTLRVFEQRAGEKMALPPEAIGAKRGFRVVPAIANNYALSHRLDELGITYPAQPSTTVPGEKELQYHLFRTMWDLMQESLIAGRKVDFNEEVALREYLDRARQIHSGKTPRDPVTPTPSNTASGAPIEFQPSLTFDGKGDYVEIPNFPNPTEAMTISCWVKSNTPTWNNTGFFASKRNAFVFHPNANAKSIHFYIFSAGGWRYTTVNPDIDITEWHHYAGTFDGHSVRLYIDGEEVARANYEGAIDLDNGSLFIGWDDGVAGRYFEGQMTEIRLWDIARREQNIKGDMNNRLVGDEPGLVGYWPLMGDASDKTGSGKDGEINGATYQ